MGLLWGPAYGGLPRSCQAGPSARLAVHRSSLSRWHACRRRAHRGPCSLCGGLRVQAQGGGPGVQGPDGGRSRGDDRGLCEGGKAVRGGGCGRGGGARGARLHSVPVPVPGPQHARRQVGRQPREPRAHDAGGDAADPSGGAQGLHRWGARVAGAGVREGRVEHGPRRDRAGRAVGGGGRRRLRVRVCLRALADARDGEAQGLARRAAAGLGVPRRAACGRGAHDMRRRQVRQRRPDRHGQRRGRGAHRHHLHQHPGLPRPSHR
mmetsp:Transcript_47436/g.95055  ORF Transcript_47436/g.95055 Transcript_47436/m.95055 type:complete len:264 (-) Transcript_47436:232-1023(-)